MHTWYALGIPIILVLVTWRLNSNMKTYHRGTRDVVREENGITQDMDSDLESRLDKMWKQFDEFRKEVWRRLDEMQKEK